MLRQYIQLSNRISVEVGVNAMKQGKQFLPVTHLDGSIKNIPITSLRMQTYTKGTSCVNCGREGHFFIVERQRNDRGSRGHFNLYHEQKGGFLRMMTSDHIIAKSRGGSNVDLANRQPMCCYCNFRKGNLLPGESYPEKKKKDTGPSRTRSTLKFFLQLTENVRKGMPLERFWEVRAKSLTCLLRNETHLTDEEKESFRTAALIG